MSVPKTWTECHEEVSRAGQAAPCDAVPVVAIRGDVESGWAVENPMSWYPVCAKHVRAPMVPLWDLVMWASGPLPTPPVDTSEGAWEAQANGLPMPERMNAGSES